MGGKQPGEIAIAVIAELLAVRDGREVPHRRLPRRVVPKIALPLASRPVAETSSEE